MKKEKLFQVWEFVKETGRKFISGVQKHEGALTLAGVVALLVYYLLGGDDPDSGVTIAIALTGMTGGVSINGEPVTLENADASSEGLIRSAIDSRVVKIRPAATPLDQISRWAGARPIGSMKAEYYAVDNKPFSCKVSQAENGGGSSATLQVENRNMFSVSDTLLAPNVKVANGAGKEEPLVMYVSAISRDGITVIPINNYKDNTSVMPKVDFNTELVRMGRAAAELDVQTDQYEALPTKDYNYCQIFKSQIEQSTLMKLSNKEVKWTLGDMEESAIVDMRLAMERSFLFGMRAKIENPETSETVYLTGGIWNQAGKDHGYREFNSAEMIEICRKAFTGSGGSNKKILIGGSQLLAELNKLENSKITIGTQSKVVWGIDFTEIVTHFGSLYVSMSEIFDQAGKAGCGMVIDPEYLVKYSHIPFSTERLNLRESGQRNTEAIVITEASCLVLRYPTSHMRIFND